MFGVINGKDALGLMEDMAILNTNRQILESQSRGQQQARQEHISAQEHANAAMVGAAVAIKVRDNKLQEMDTKLNETANGWGCARAANRSAVQTLDAAIKEIAKIKELNESDVRFYMQSIRSRAYDNAINEGISKGEISRDPRCSVETLPDWYIPDSCV